MQAGKHCLIKNFINKMHASVYHVIVWVDYITYVLDSNCHKGKAGSLCHASFSPRALLSSVLSAQAAAGGKKASFAS